MLFDLLADEAYYSQPIALRHPIVFYEGHLPAFSFNTLVKRALGGASIDPQLEPLFARGIDPRRSRRRRGAPRAIVWPARDVVRGFVEEADRRVLDVLEREELDRPGHPLLESRGSRVRHPRARGDAPGDAALHVAPAAVRSEAAARRLSRRASMDRACRRQQWLSAAWTGDARRGSGGGSVRLGQRVPVLRRRGAGVCDRAPRRDQRARSWSSWRPADTRDPQWWRPDDWAWIQQERVTHPLFWERQDGGWQWRGMFDLIAVAAGVAGVCQLRRGERVLPLARRPPADRSGVPARGVRHAGRDRAHVSVGQFAMPTTHRGVFDFTSWDPEPAGSHPQGASAWGVEDLVGNGWEWTSTPFGPFPGFAPMASYPGILGRLLRRASTSS